MKQSAHIITFLKRVKQFSQKEGITSILKVDNYHTVDDVMNVSETTGGLIADIDNDLSEIIDQLEQYYIDTDNKKLLKRLKTTLNK